MLSMKGLKLGPGPRNAYYLNTVETPTFSSSRIRIFILFIYPAPVNQLSSRQSNRITPTLLKNFEADLYSLRGNRNYPITSSIFENLKADYTEMVTRSIAIPLQPG